MNALEFCYWLQGYSEINGSLPNDNEWQIILDHIKEVEEIQPKLIAGAPIIWSQEKIGGIATPVIRRSIGSDSRGIPAGYYC